jgi:hypothetical protein
MCLSCHVVVVKTRIKSLETLRRAVQRMGGEFRENQRQYKWYGHWMDDYHEQDAAYKQGIQVGNYGKCDHAIHIPNVDYEVGIVQKGEEFTLIWDFIDGRLRDWMGGQEASKLTQLYNVELEKQKALENGYSVEERTEEDGTITITATMWG